jgi:excisionase family DNA binding protein
MSLLSNASELAMLLTYDDVALHLNCSIRTVANLVRDGELTPIRVRRSVRFHPDQLQNLILTQMQKHLPRHLRQPLATDDPMPVTPSDNILISLENSDGS